MENAIGQSALDLAVDIRTISAELLPIDHSFIPFDLLMRIGVEYIHGNQLTLKSLFTSLPHSEMGMRYHFRHMIENDWIQVHPSPTDRRSKLVTPTCKLIGALIVLDTELRRSISHYTPDTNKRISWVTPKPFGVQDEL